MKKVLSLGFSPCPNDTFMFYPLVHGLVDAGNLEYVERLEDVETLNRLAVQGVLDVTKVSYAAFGHIREQYALLRAGSALGRGCGPLLVTSTGQTLESLKGKRIAIPGHYTTASLLLRLCAPELDCLVEMPFHQIMESVASGLVDAGVIIHESRFTYQQHGLQQLVDLGVWWEGETGLPIPLGGIVARRSLGAETISLIERSLGQAVEYARANPVAAAEYIREHAQEMDSDVCAAHIGLYVNDFSQNLGAEGEQAIIELLRRAEASGIIPSASVGLFAADSETGG